MKRLLPKAAVSIVFAALLAVVVALPAAADGPTRVPVLNSDFTATGVCSFGIQATVDKQNETMTTWEKKDGTLVSYVSGTYKVTLTNLETGYSLALNLTQAVHWTIYPDGSISGQVTGGTALVPGYWDITHGRLTLTYAPGWILTSVAFNGHSEDVCAALDH